MNILITGVAGFIGSTLAERLIGQGHFVRGVDCFTDHYPKQIKEDNILSCLNSSNFEFINSDLRIYDISKLLNKIDLIFHLSAQPGVRSSWGNNFSIYTEHNILVTQRLLEAIKSYPIQKFIFASTSSIYGNIPNNEIMSESMKPQPISPYGVTKLAGEHLCLLYWKNYNIPVSILRYFTVYGPRQRPDMAFHKFIRSIFEKKPITVYGDGTQKRDFTYIDDVIDGNILAMEHAKTGEIYNIGGGHIVVLSDILNLLSELTHTKLNIIYQEKQYGDVYSTSADISRAKAELGYNPKSDIRQGLRKEIDWFKSKLT